MMRVRGIPLDELARAALEQAERSEVEAADVRVVPCERYEQLAVRNGVANALTYATAGGIGVRVRTKFAWGFATTTGLSRAAARSVAASAVRAARCAGAGVRSPLELAPVESSRGGHYETPMKVDPFDLDREEKLSLLKEAERRLHHSREVKAGLASFQAWEERKTFASTEGVEYESRIVHVGAGVQATAVASGESQRRSAPTSFGGDYRQAGFEFVRSLDLPGRATVAGKEATQLLRARRCPSAETTVVLATDQLALQVHESVGHATELDRILAMEAGFAGTSWVKLPDIGRLRYGSDAMTVVADATEPGGLGSFGWDDEGVASQRNPLISEGRLVGVLTSRETARVVGLRRSGGTARAEGFYRMPLVRMTNVDLQPGDYGFDELLEGVRDGVYFETNRSWSIDDRRLNFQFGTEVGRRIRHGELGELLRNPIYSGMTPEFWGSMDAVGDRSTWHLWGLPNCGKGQPGQAAHVGHGAPAARFRSIRVRGG